MGNFVSPGHYFRELDFSEYAPQLSTSIIGVVGTATRGPINTPTFITNIDQAIEKFGYPTPDSYMMYSIIQALKKANKVWVVRVAGGSSNGLPYTSVAKAKTEVNGGASAGLVRGSNFELFSIQASMTARHVGNELEDFNISIAANNNQFSIRVDSGSGFGADQTVTIPDGVYTAATLAAQINALTTGLNCTDSNGFLKIETVLAGVEKRFEILDVSNSCYTTLGLTIGVYTGSNGTDGLQVVLTGTGSGTQNFILPPGAGITAQQVVDAINATAANFVATRNARGQIVLTKSQTGSSEGIQVHADSTADTVLGLDNLVHNGTSGSSLTARFWAATEGTWANYLGAKPGMYVTISPTVKSEPEGTFKIEVYTANGILRAKWTNLSKDPASPNYYVDVVGDSNGWLTIEDMTGVSSNPIEGTYQFALGANGISDVSDADYIGIVDGTFRSGLQLLGNAEAIDINIMCVPGVTSEAVQTALLNLCESERRDCFAVLDTPFGLNVQEAADFVNGEGSFSSRPSLNTSYGGVYWSWVRVYDNYNEQDIWIPPCGFVLAVYAYTDFVADVWWAPAGLIRGRLQEALELEHSPTQGERDFLYGDGNVVNPLVDFVGDGIVIFGQRTLQRRASALDRVNVRRMLLYAEKVVATSAKYLVFEQNDAVTWRRYIRLITPIFDSIKARRGLYDFKIICDESTNPPELIDQNMMQGKILLKPTKSAEIIATDFIIVPTGANFTEFV